MYKIEDFLKDDKFVDWVKGNDKSTEGKWLDLMKDHEIGQIISEAIFVIQSLRYKRDLVSNEHMTEDLLESILKTRNERKVPRDSNFNLNTSVLVIKQYWVAATIILLFGSYLMVQKWREPTATVAAQQEFVSKYVPKGEKLNLTLTDGTEIKINSGGLIRFPKTFKGHERRIYLEGEAFLKVSHDDKKAFVVETGSLDVKVLGTSFNIQNDLKNSNVEVALVDGKVVVTQPNGNSILLNPYERVNFSGDKISKDKFDPKEVLAWVEGVLLFKNASSDEVVLLLEDWYDIEFVLSDREKLLTVCITADTIMKLLRRPWTELALLQGLIII